MEPKLIGEKIEAMIGDKNKKVVADELGISYSALRMYITGQRIPKDEIKIKMAVYFNKTVDEIFFNSKEHEMYSKDKKVG